MRRSLLLPIVAAFAVSISFAQTPRLYVTPDVPTIPDGGATLVACGGGPLLVPWEVYRYDPTAARTYTCVLSVPGRPHIDAIHKLDSPGDFLLSVEQPSNLGGVLLPAASRAMPEDVIHYDGSSGTYSLCFVGAGLGISRGNVDAVYRRGDTGDLVVSFDIPTTLGSSTFEPSDLVRWVPSTASICPATWTLAAANPTFDASAAGSGLALSINVNGADERNGRFLLALDIPASLSPPAQPTRVPGNVVSFSAGSWSLFAVLQGWPTRTAVDGLSSLANPGVVAATLEVGKTGQLDTSPIVLSWSPSCSPDGAADYGIYEGAIGTWYSHTSAGIDDCNDAGSNLTETVTPSPGDRYYLVVPHNGFAEGSYGTCSPSAGCGPGNERPAGTAVCASPRVITACPSS
jgi:hypothetical protein